MQTRYLEEPLAYDGSQLRAHWILRHCGLVGNAMVAFRGPCDVKLDEMADLADIDGPGIVGSDMLHFIQERFDDSLDAAMLRQRLLSCIAGEVLRESGADVRRDGDDLFVGDGKLSISIATRSLVSTLVHFALNVSTEGVPVEAAALQDVDVDPRQFADAVLARAVAEESSLVVARAKVRAKGEAR